MSQTVLERLREAMRDERRDAAPRAPEARGRVWVTPDGRVVIGVEQGDAEQRMLSKVHPAVFA
ncbi:hypothetical protein [Anaeromyxobacter sp. PSR-1]|uniref:hypothetical protein n=1 Tax=Anaeromyxobacter sp. PSR-1 TaxID=1300915 RepID=UPI0005DE2627|nr:hypothetical protein [Anaeromyxobacter sp. PSR-1]GAO03164.1 hypothetical protein PSR1_02047 [Anaeromyxobacter sp. PSR-1]